MIHKVIKINHTAVSNSMNTCRILILMLMTASVFSLGAGVGAAEDVNVTLYPTLNEITEGTENKEILYLENGYTVRIKDINKYVFPHKIWLVLEKNSIELDDKILETGHEYSWHNDEDYIALNAEIFVGTDMDVVFFKNVYQISNGDTIVDNETFTLMYSDGISGSLNLNTADYNNIEGSPDGSPASNKNIVQSSSFPPASGYSQEFLKENYSLTLEQVDIEGKKALISLSKNGKEVDSKVKSIGDSFNYNSSLSFRLDKVFAGTSGNFIEISNIYQYSEEDSSVLVQNESALLRRGLTGKFILTGGGLEWQLEENYTLHTIDIEAAGHSREAFLLITKDGTPVDYAIINVSDSYTYYKNENLIITADLETIFSGEGGVSLARLHHVYQYLEDTGETLLSDAMHLYSVGDTREVEWQLNQDYSLSAMDIDSKGTPRQVWLRLSKDGNTLEDKFLLSEDSAIFYNSGTQILDLNVGTIFDGREGDLVFISDVYQYSETKKKDILIENEQHLFIFGSSRGNDWQLYENYNLSFMDIDIKEYPNQVWLRMKKNGVPVDDNVVARNEDYKYYNNSALLFEGYIKSTFGGRYLDMLILSNASQYSKVDNTPLITDATYTFYPENVELFMDLNDKLSLGENYTIVPVDVQGFYNPNTLWLRLYKDNVMVDEVILLEDQDYSYYNGSIKIISTTLDVIFMGMNTELIKFIDIYQYSEVDGSLLNYYDRLLLRLGYYSPPSAPAIISFEPTTPTSDVVDATRKFTIFVNQSVDVNWYLNGTGIQLNESVSNAEYTNTSASAGTWNISAIANNANGIAKQNWTWKVYPKTYPSGNRIWDEDAGMSDTYTWDPQSFSGFYYDLDIDEGSETLTIKNIDRSLKKGEIEYKTKPIPVQFENSRWGTYNIIGFMANRYFAGYNDTDFASSKDNLLSKEKLSRVLTDNDIKVRLNSGSQLELEEGYEFKITEFSTSGESIMVGLFKDGDMVSETAVEEEDTFVYEKDLGKAKDMPIIAIYIDNVSIGQETSYVNIEGIFQISDKYIDVDKGDEFGLMKIKSVSSNGITMKNDDSVSLSEGDDFNLMGKINIIVADDSSTLRFAPYVDMTEPGTYELRGTVTEENEFDWTPFNFEALMYDIDTGEWGEILHLERDGRTVDEGDLTYTINPITQNFEHSNDGWNGFQSIGFMGEKYFAGYLKASSFVSSDRSLISEGKLSKILMDEDKKHTLYIGNSLSLQDGYSMRIDEISQDEDNLMLAILKDGDELSTEIVSEGDNFVYEIEVNKTDIPIIVIHIGKVLGDVETNSVFIDGIFQISDRFTSVERGDTYGIMEVTETTPSIMLSNEDDSISLDEGDVIDIMGDIKIKVADNGKAVRFYPYQEILVEEPLYLDLDIPKSVYENEEFTISVTSNGDKVESVSITFNDSGIGTTDSNGELIYTPTETGKFKVTASKFGYQDAFKYIDVTDPNARLEYSNLTIEPKSVQPGEDVNITVVASNLGTFQDTDTMTLKVNGEEVMTKDLSLGPGESTTIEYTLNRSKSGTYLVEVDGQSDTFKVVSSLIIPTIPVILVENVTAAPNGYAFTSVTVNNVTELGSGKVSITFDPSAIQVIDVTSGDGNALIVQDWNVDNTAGLLEIAAWDANDPHNGDVVFANLTLHSIGDHLNSTTLAISSAELINYTTLELITHTVAPGTVDTIAPDVVIDNVEADPGESTTALVMVNNASNLGSGSITVTYNSSVVHVTNVTSGDGNALVVQEWNVDNTAGSVEIAAWDADESHSGDVVFANVTFHAVGEYPDSTLLAISSSELIDYTSYGSIGHSVTNGTFIILDNESPVIIDAIATPDVILNDNGRPRTPGTNVTVLNATVANGGSGVANVSIDLSPIGGPDDQVMERIAGTDVWTVATTATEGINLTHELVVTASDRANNTNTSVIGLTVLLRGDVVRDGELNSGDALYIAKYLVGKEDMLALLVGDIFPAEGDGKIATADALYLAKYLVGKEVAP